jgi:hypothetical protein
MDALCVEGAPGKRITLSSKPNLELRFVVAAIVHGFLGQ